MDTQETDDLEVTNDRGQRWFDQYLYASGEALQALVARTLSYLEHHETHTDARQRKRSKQAQASFEAALQAVVVNLVYGHLRPPKVPGVVLSRRTGVRKTRYDNPELNIRTLLSVADSLRECGVLRQRLGNRGGSTSSIHPTRWFIRRIEEAGVTISDFGRHDHEEVLVLVQKGAVDWSQGRPQSAKLKDRVDYTDTPETEALRAQVRALNAFLATGDVTLRGAPLPAIDRALKRHFTVLPTQHGTERFDQGGRLFGGAWMPLPKADRVRLRINGEPIADLDYQNMFARLAYASVGVVPPEGDLYDLTGVLEGYDDGVHRGGAKEAFNSLFFGGKAGKRETLRKLPEGTTAARIREAFGTKHPALRPLFGSHVGFSLMFTESRVLLSALEVLMDQGIVALPIHDGIMCQASREEAVRAAMEWAAREVVGADLPVVSKPVA